MSISTASAARMICESGGWKVTNLELQKILYMAHMLHLGRTGGAPLVGGRFEAWDYGPVEPELYRRVRMFGSDAIKDVFWGAEPVEEGAAEHATLKLACDALIGKSPGELVSLTHWSEGAWAKVYQPGVLHIPIPNELIFDEYRAWERRAEREAV